MGFLSFNLHFYRSELLRLESAVPSPGGIYRARQLLRMLDDLADEGYTELHVQLEDAFHGVTRLREYLQRNGAEPFQTTKNHPSAEMLSYSERETELNQAIAQLIRAANESADTAMLPFVGRLRRFCQWTGYESGTAYIFLLRDTLLPFVYNLVRHRMQIYPWLLGRKSFAALTGKQNADDAIRASIYRALEEGCTDSRSFLTFVLPDMRKTMAAYPHAENMLRAMLGRIAAEKILVVESGCAGTFPLLLMSLDDRVDMRMYTTYPYLTDIYKTRIFTTRYEENRMFESMASQELYFRFSEMRDGRFYVRRCTDAQIERQSLREIRMMIKEERQKLWKKQ